MMADKENKVTQDSKVEKATTDESAAAAKIAKAAKGNKKSDKPSFFTRASKGTKKFVKDFKGECKKIVWPDAKTVLKSTGIVLLVVAIVSIVVGVIDLGLSSGVKGLKNLALGEETTIESTETADEHEGHDHGDEETDEDEGSEEETTEAKAEESTEDKAEDTTAESAE